MEPLELRTHSFIVKVWLEEDAGPAHRPTWRGHVTHVPDGERRYVKNTEEILAFIEPYLAAMGAQVDARWRIKRWLRQLTDKSEL